MDLDTVTGCLDYYGGMAASLAGQHVKMGGGSWAYVTREPLGVVGGIGAWNYPMQVRFVSLILCKTKVGNSGSNWKRIYSIGKFL